VQTHTRLNKSLVTVNFTVTPVPFSDRYDITIEQTFETHVPIPVLVLTPAFQEFDNVTPGFQASYIVTAKNEGLVQMTDLTIIGQQTGPGTLTPLITYVPVLGAGQSIDIPMTAVYWGTNAPTRQGNPLSDCAKSQFGNGELVGDFLAGADAFAKAVCPKDRAAIDIGAGAVAAWYLAHQALKPAAAAAKFLGCVLGHLLGGMGDIPTDAGSYIQTAQPSQSMQQFQQVQAGCFAAETRVMMADGRFKTIDQIKPGDVVKSGVDRLSVATVEGTIEREDNTCREIRFALPGQAQPDSVITTDEHLFWEDGLGWIAASQLKAGEWLSNEYGQRVQIISNERLDGSREVYTLKLRGDTAFYANGVLVHDLCGQLPTAGAARADGVSTGQKPSSDQKSK
jgi:hypothetical protein